MAALGADVVADKGMTVFPRNENGMVRLGQEVQRQGADTTCTATEWRSKAQTSNGNDKR